jgi:hypothetical protein
MDPRIFAFASVLVALVAPLSTCFHFPRASLSPTNVTFGPQVVLTTSAAKLVTLKNSGLGGSLTISGIVASGDYSQTNECPSTLPQGASCTIDVAFAPNALGTVNDGAITVATNAPGGEVVSLSGTGIAPVALSPPSLNFGHLPVGTTSAAKTVTLTNNQSTSLTISGISTTGDYSQVNNCPSSLNAGAACTISVNFHPTVAANVPGALTLSSSAVPGSQPVQLSGSGSGSVTSQVAFSPKSVAFGMQEAGTASPAQTVTLRNISSSSSLTVSAVISSGPNYPVTNTCAGKLIAPGGTCSIAVAFKPNANFATASYPGGITVLDSDGTSPQVVGLSGAGVPPVTTSPSSLSFGTTASGATSAAQTVTLVNRHATAESLTIVTSGYYVMTSNSCSNPLPPGSSCSIALAFSPTGLSLFAGFDRGNIKGAATVKPSSGGKLSPEVVSLAACGTIARPAPASLSFGSESVGATSSPKVVTLTNVATGLGANPKLYINQVGKGGPDSSDFVISNNTCDSGLEPGGQCTVSVEFKPTATGKRSGTLNFFDNGACSPQQVLLAGTGT